ncbi:MAG: HAMP domain-containing protein [Candidatus Zixiibacteriota bacterium]|nr:MAG: HAMP domain-containing protein [candidate division Zixibacteria bacterium]
MLSKSIGARVILVVGFILILSIGIYAYVNVASQKKQLTEEVMRGAFRISETVRRSTRYDMLKNQSDDVHQIIETIGEQEGLEKIRVFNKDGKIMFSTDKLEIGEMVDKKAEACYACHSAEKPLERLTTPDRSRIFTSRSGHRVLGVISAIYNEPDCYTPDCHAHPPEQKVLGVLDIGMSLEDVDKDIKSTQNKMIVFAIIAFLVISATISVSINRYVTRPVRELVKETRKISEGDLSNSISIKTEDEIGQLGSAFTQMTLDLKKADEKLVEWAKTLEQKVEERTEELTKTQNQLIQSEKMASLGKLAAGVAHEINSPLTGVLTYSSLLLEAKKEEDPEKEDLEVIVNETNRCKKIVKGLLEFARQTEPQKASSDINRLIDKSIDLIFHQAGLQNVKIEKKMKVRFPKIMVDVGQIQQVFINILLNAIESMPQGGSLVVSSGIEDEMAAIRFTDTGHGISEKDLPKIFDPFFTTKRQGQGTGLGLSVSYGIIERHRGKLGVKSKVGKGTTFTVKLPITESSSEIPQKGLSE